jgi:hypothetical protein
MTDLTDADRLVISKVTTKWLVRPEKYPGPYADELFAAGKAAGRREGMEEATRQWAHWKDGVQYVGTCGTTLAAALAKIREAAKG